MKDSTKSRILEKISKLQKENSKLKRQNDEFFKKIKQNEDFEREIARILIDDMESAQRIDNPCSEISLGKPTECILPVPECTDNEPEETCGCFLDGNPDRDLDGNTEYDYRGYSID